MKSSIDRIIEKSSNRFPSRNEALQVFSVVNFIVFSWTFYRIFWNIPSWLEHMRIDNILVTAAYILSFALLESAIIFTILYMISWLLPKRLFRDQFVSLSCSVVILLGFGAFLFQRNVKVLYRLSYYELLIYLVFIILGVLLSTLIFSYLFKRFGILPRWIQIIAERMTIFNYLYVPLGILGLLVVLVRNSINLIIGFIQ